MHLTTLVQFCKHLPSEPNSELIHVSNAGLCVLCLLFVWLSQFLGMCTTFSLWMRKWTKYLSNMTSKIQIRQPGPRALTSWRGCHFSASIKNTNTSLLVNPWMEGQEPCKPWFLNSGSGPHTKLKQQSERKIQNINTVNPCDICLWFMVLEDFLHFFHFLESLDGCCFFKPLTQWPSPSFSAKLWTFLWRLTEVSHCETVKSSIGTF